MSSWLRATEEIPALQALLTETRTQVGDLFLPLTQSLHPPDPLNSIDMKNVKIIIYDQPDFYFPGSTVMGKLVVTVEKPGEYYKIVVGMSGKAAVRWTTGSGNYQSVHHGSVSYMKESSTVWSKEDYSGDLAIGDHTYPFEFQLPDDAPASFESCVDNVRYEINAKVFLTGLLKCNIKGKALIKVGDNMDRLWSQKWLKCQKKLTSSVLTTEL